MYVLKLLFYSIPQVSIHNHSLGRRPINKEKIVKLDACYLTISYDL